MSGLKPISECRTVAELLADERRWVKGAYAVNQNGHPCDTRNDEAVRWCLLGACSRIYRDFRTSLECVALHQDIVEMSGEIVTIFDYNDAESRTHAEVLELVTRLGI